METSTPISERVEEKSARLILADGTVFEGLSFGAEVNISGECVFQTGMVGYPESLTDPSYRGQILVLSYPLIGNYGIPKRSVDEYGLLHFFESEKVHIAGLVVGSYSNQYSHWNAEQSLGDFLKKHNIPAIHGVDTRSLIKIIRQGGTPLAKLESVYKESEEINIEGMEDPNLRNLVAEVSTKEVRVYGSGPLTVLAVDCGMKYNQIRCLLKRGLRVKVVPWNHDLLAEDESSYHGVFLSNGPGDPAMLKEYTVKNIAALIKREEAKDKPKPIFGICIGNQLLGLAVGAKTYKLPFGNRGHNQPCVDQKTKRCHLTMQNHGFAIDSTTLPPSWKEYFINANDQTNEGIYHVSKPFSSVQFHPEAKGGPTDTEYLFDIFVGQIQGTPIDHPMAKPGPVPQRPRVTKVLILGSGGLSIGQAGEFDYSGSQAIKALKEENIKTILLNPNIATVQTSSGLADKVYFLPVTPEYVIKVIKWERPDGILLTFGGQTALNCGMELYKQGIFEELGVKVLGTPLDTIIATEDREIFAHELKKIDESIAPSFAARTVREALDAAETIGYPVVVRAGFALGGLGSGFADNEEQLLELAKHALVQSEQVLVEKSLKGWKEIEYEVVRDGYDNCITVCNMENFDPLGVHTGESIVVAPSQTLTDQEYHMLRRVGIKVVRHLGVVGECNIQYALNPESEEYFIIEVNARLSRSSALASKATGYPLAFVAAKLALGIDLPSLRNSVTKVTTACFEPSLDYLVVKVPRWDLQKFERVDNLIGTSMKSVGEVMSIGRTFEEAIQKALRMVSQHWDGFLSGYAKASKEGLLPSSNRIAVIAQALYEGYTVEEVHQITKIDRWFLYKLERISKFEHLLRGLTKSGEGASDILPKSLMQKAKRLGFSDKGIAKCINSTELVVRNLRTKLGILPFVKRIDTVSAEFPATNNYLFMTYNASASDEDYGQVGEKAIIVLGSGAYCIGSSVEFDYCAVSCIRTLSKLGKKTIMINYNPETVSTDYDECDKLYFEELSFERVIDIYNYEAAQGIVVSMGGQISNNIAMALRHHDIKVIGTSPEWIEAAENRFKFSRMLDIEGVDQPKWKDCSNFADTKKFCDEVGYPCLVRPSFVLSGAGMNVVNSSNELEAFLKKATVFSEEHHVVISKFITDAKEIDLDGVAKDGEVLVFAISEHVENAGVHSGDASLVLPAQDLDKETVTKVEIAARKIAKQLRVTGPFNIQFIAKNKEIKVIECNLRASRSFPFVSKTYGVDLIDYATKAMIPDYDLEPLVLPQVTHVGVKVPQFSFARLKGSDPVLGVEMASTGEVACFGENKYSAYLKALLSSGFKMPKKKNVLLSIGPYKEKLEFLGYVKKLARLGFTLFASSGTAEFLSENGMTVKCLDWPNSEEDMPDSSSENSLEKHFSNAMIDLCIILPSNNRNRRPASFMSQGYRTRRLAIDFSVPLITNIKCAKLFVESLWVVRDDIKVGLVDSRSSHRTVILPGLIDVHVHMREPGACHKEDWDSGTAAALAGGFTIVCAMPNTNPPTVDEESMEEVSKLANDKARCDYGLYFGATNTNATIIPALSHSSIGLKLYLNHTFSALRLKDLTVWMDHFQNWPKELPLVVHAEKETMAAALMCATLANRSIHIAHISLAEELHLVRAAKLQGLKVTCEVAPHHLFMSAEDIKALGDGRGEVRPCLASSHDKEALWENMDMIDCIATDHAPHTLAEKDSSSPPPGFPGLETALALMLTAVNEGKITLEDLIEKMHTNPKRIFNLPDQEDTYIEVDLDEEWRIPGAAEEGSDTGPYTRCGWTPFAGRKVKGRVRRVVLRGEIAMLDGKVLAKQGTGKNLSASKGKPIHPYGGTVMLPLATTSAAVHVFKKEPIQPAAIISSPLERSMRGVFGTSPDQSSISMRFANQQRQQPSSKEVLGGSSPRSPRRERSFGSLSSSAAGKELALQKVEKVPTSLSPNMEDFKENFLSSHGKKLHRLQARHIVSVKQFSYEDLRYLFSVAHDMRVMVKCMGCLDLLKGKVLANTFYEPSTRTASSFHAAMVRLGGSVFNITEQASSIAKGESLPDTIRTLESYADIIVLRHPMAGAAEIAAQHAHVPVINAGDGVGEHPSQALLDVFTIREERGTVNGLRITLVGDLKNGRTVHSLVHLLSLYSIAELNYVSPPSLRMPREIIDEIEKKGIPQKEYTDLDEVIDRTDVLYVTRIQKERFASIEEFNQVKGSYVITPESLSKAKSNMVVMHPLPRIDEISTELDTDPRAAYFRQMENGMYIRMALLAIVLGKV